MWQNQLQLYNNATYQDLILKWNGKKVFFVPQTSVDASIVAAVQSNGGRNDIVVVYMWAEFGVAEFEKGLWAFFSPNTINGQYTTSVAVGPTTDGGVPPPAGQYVTTNSPLGASVTASPSYQLSYASLPFAAAGKYGGLTFKRQFGSVIAAPAGTHVFMSSWNELIAQPQPNHFKSQHALSMGFNATRGGRSLWVDSFGAALSRDIEPTVAGGAGYYSIMSSCLRVTAMARAGAVSGCTVAGEECCALAAASDSWSNTWALTDPAGADALLTVDANELHVLTGQGWHAACNPYNGPAGTFCVDPSLASAPNDPRAVQGPFAMLATPGPGRAALYRCITADGHHFFSPSSTCEGQTVEHVLGYTASAPTTETPRSLRRCRQNALYTHALDAACPAGYVDEGMYGYVR